MELGLAGRVAFTAAGLEAASVSGPGLHELFERSFADRGRQ